MHSQEECSIRYDETEREVIQADAQWKLLEEQLEGAEERFLVNRLDYLKKWFGLGLDDLQVIKEGSLRMQIRTSIHGLLLGPMIRKMVHEVAWTPPSSTPPEELSGVDVEFSKGTEVSDFFPVSSNEFLVALLAHVMRRMRPIVARAQERDEELAKKIRRTEKEERQKGIVALGMQDTKKVAALKRERPEIWEEAQRVVGKFCSPMRLLKMFMKEHASADTARRLQKAVPVIVVRAICDWFFQKSMLSYEQLSQWWKNTEVTLKNDQQLWDLLIEEEGVIVRRISMAFEDIDSVRRNYLLYANFGGAELEVQTLLANPIVEGEPIDDIPPQFEDQIFLLVRQVSEIHQRLNAIRVGAVWRVVETVQNINQQLKTQDAANVSPWQAVSVQNGAATLARALGIDDFVTERLVEGQQDADSISEAVVVVMSRLDRLMNAAAEAQALVIKEPGLNDVGLNAVRCVFNDFINVTAGLQENLLVVLDEPSVATVETWLQEFGTFGGSADVCQKLAKALDSLPLKPDAALSAALRKSRASWTSIARGMQAFLENDQLLLHVASPLRVAKGVGHVPLLSEVCAAAAEPRSPVATVSAAAAELRKNLDISMPLSPRPVTEGKSNYTYNPPRRRTSTEFAQSSSASKPSNQSGSSPNFISGWRPDTPSTTTPEDAEYRPRTPSSKVVEGNLVPSRPGSGVRRLPPLDLGGLSPGG